VIRKSASWLLPPALLRHPGEGGRRKIEFCGSVRWLRRDHRPRGL